MSNVAMIGCGKLGLPCAEQMATMHRVKGYDVADFASETVESCSSILDAVCDADIIFVAVPTPHDPAYDGSAPTCHLPPRDFDYTVVLEVLSEIARHVTPEQVVVLISTVLPGTIRTTLRDVISKMTFLYNPYLIAMGTVSWDMVNPEMIIVGNETGVNTPETTMLSEFYSTIMQNNPRTEIGTWDEAECIKIFYNTFISAKVGLVNMIQDVAQKQGNIDVDVVAGALQRSTHRITGPGYMTPGMGDGGACHPRDNIALRYLADNLGLGYDLFESIMLAREVQARNMAEHLVSYNMPVIIVGKSYKPCVEYTNGSSSMLVGHYVNELGTDVYYLDPLTNDAPPSHALATPATYLIAHNANVTYGTGEPDTVNPPAGSVIVDPWRKHPHITDCITVHYGNTRGQI